MDGWMKFVAFLLPITCTVEKVRSTNTDLTPSMAPLEQQQFVSWEAYDTASCRWYVSGHWILDVADGQPCIPISDTCFRHRGIGKWRDRVTGTDYPMWPNRKVENFFRRIELHRMSMSMPGSHVAGPFWAQAVNQKTL